MPMQMLLVTRRVRAGVSVSLLATLLALVAFFALETGAVNPLSPQCFTEVTGDNITDFSSGDAQALRDALGVAAPGGTVKVAGTCAGAVTELGTAQVAVITQTLTVAGGYTTTNWSSYDPLANPTTVDALRSGRGLYVTVDATLQGFTVTNGLVDAATDAYGGGIYAGAGLTLTQMTMYSNTATGSAGDHHGGGAFIQNRATVVDSTFAMNQASSDGGGLRGVGDATITGTLFLSNTAATGGGAVFDSASTVIGTRFTGNTAGAAGSAGGGYFNGVATLTNVDFAYNGAGTAGGGGAVFAGAAALSGGSFAGNGAAFAGGGAYFNGLAEVDGTTFAGNTVTANRGGGAYFNDLADLANVTFTGNAAAADRGGGAYFRSAAALSASSFVSNTASNRAGGAYFFAAVTMTNTNFISNTGTIRGGGAYLGDDAEVSGGRIEANQCTGSCLGGGLYLSGTLILDDVTFLRNTTDGSGGGLFVVGGAALTNSRFEANQAGAGGGAVLNNGGITTISVAQIYSNSATAGGGIYNGAGGVTIVDGSTLLSNTASSNGGAFYQADDASTSTVTGNCIVGNRAAAVAYTGGVSPLTATDNWWGHASGPSGAGPGVGDSVTSDVDYTGFLGAAILGCPTIPDILTVAVVGSGRVSSNPAGIDCGGACVASFPYSTVVTLTSVATLTGTQFEGWSGACTGAGPCVVAMSAARAVTATYTVTGAGNIRVDPLGSSGLSIELDAALPMSGYDTCTWDFGDSQQQPCAAGLAGAAPGAADILQSVTHVYVAEGTYTASIATTNAAGSFTDRVTFRATAPTDLPGGGEPAAAGHLFLPALMR